MTQNIRQDEQDGQDVIRLNQLVNYLTATGKDVGLIINFGERRVEIKRKVRELAES